MLDTRKSGLIQTAPPSLSRNELYVSEAPAEIKPAIRQAGHSFLDKFGNNQNVHEANSETVVTAPRMVEQPVGGAFSIGDNVRLVADAVGMQGASHLDFIANGDFATDTLWTKGTGWTIAALVASSDGTQAGDSDLTQIGANLTNALVQGATYTVTFTVTAYTAGNVTPVVGDTEGTDRAATGTFTEQIVAGAGVDIDIRADVDFVGSIDNVIVKQVGGVSVDITQWQLDLSDVVGETESILVLDNIQVGDAGSYTCDFTNSAGTTTSAAAVVTVS